MNFSTKSRLFISLIVLVMVVLLVAPISILFDLQNTRYSALTSCIKDNFHLFDFCYKKSHEDISLSLISLATPFVPAAVLIWLTWLFKVDLQLEASPTNYRLFRRVAFYAGYAAGMLGIFFPHYIVFEEAVESLHSVVINNLFLMPWVAISWLCAPILFQKLLDYQHSMSELISLRKVALATLISPFAATLFLIIRQSFKI